MNRFSLPVALLASLVVTLPAMADDTAARPYTGSFIAAVPGDHGTVTVTPAPNGVIVHVEVKNMTPGWHGMHFHEKGLCEADKFTTAGSHVHAATPVLHGYLNQGANDAGDLPNIHVGEDGQGFAEVYSSLVTLTKVDDRPYLVDEDGTAVVIHDKPDDYTAQPIGNAGGRAVCAVLK